MDEQAEDGEEEGHGEELGGAEDAELGGEGLDHRECRTGHREFPQQRNDRKQQRAGAVLPIGSDAPWNKQREANAGVVEKFEAGGPLHQCKMPRRVFEQHGLMDHREFEMRGRIVDGDARVLREQHHGECDRREDDARVNDGAMTGGTVDQARQRSRTE